MIEYEHIIQELVKGISQFSFEFTFEEVMNKMELREVPKDVLYELGEKKIMENFANKVFYMRLPDGKVVDINSFSDFINKNNIKSGSVIMSNFKYVRWEVTADLTTPQIKNYIKQQLTNNNEIVLSEVKKALIFEELNNKQIDGYFGEIAIKTSNSVEQGKFYIESNCLQSQAYKLISETINELQEGKKNFVEKKLKRDKKYAVWYFVFIAIILVLWLVNNLCMFVSLPNWLSVIIGIVLYTIPLVVIRFIDHSYITRAFCVQKARIIYEREFDNETNRI